MGLTNEQEEIINHKEGPALVIAGAGAGKTFTMTERLSQLIKDGVRPENILVLTFTNAAAENMIDRVKKVVGTAADNVTACTYHSFCNKIMHRYGIPNNSYTIMDTSDETDAISLVRAENERFRGKGFPSAKVCQGLFSMHINKSLSFEDILDLSRYEKYKSALPEIEELFAKVQEYKKSKNLVGYDDMLVYAINILESSYGDSIRMLYKYVMVDEAQDTNNIQLDICRLLSPNMMFIGDPEQSIYGFRGSDVKNFLNFPKMFPGTKIYKLSSNYRSTDQILDIANGIVRRSNIEYKVELHSGKGLKGDLPKVIRCPDQKSETDFIVNKIETTKNRKELAVIFRNTAMSASLEAELVRRRILYVKMGGAKFFEMGCIRDMLAFFKVLVNPFDEISWFRILTLYEDIGEKRARSLLTAGPTFLSNNEFTGKTTSTALSINKTTKELMDFINNFPNLPYEMQLSKVQDYYFNVLDKSLDRMIEKKKASESTINERQAFIKSAKEYVPILIDIMGKYNDVEKFLDDMSLNANSSNLPDMAKNINAKEGEEGYIPDGVNDDNKVVLTTIHSAKGLEWDEVIVMDAVNGVFPRTHPEYVTWGKEQEKEFEEEERCMYVAVTRPRQNLSIMWPQSVTIFGQYYNDADLSCYVADSLNEGLFSEEMFELDY